MKSHLTVEKTNFFLKFTVAKKLFQNDKKISAFVYIYETFLQFDYLRFIATWWSLSPLASNYSNNCFDNKNIDAKSW